MLIEFATIIFHNDHEAHSVLGFKCGDDYKVYDANVIHTYSMQWTFLTDENMKPIMSIYPQFLDTVTYYLGTVVYVNRKYKSYYDSKTIEELCV